MKMLVADPHLGRDCSHIRDGYRKYASGSHVLFYRLADDGVDIVRILHERMDFGRTFRERSFLVGRLFRQKLLQPVDVVGAVLDVGVAHQGSE
jgi:hypothetical protein